MRIDLRQAQDLLLTDVLTPKRRIAQIETLVVGKAINRRGRLLAGKAVLISLISDQQTTLVSDVLTQRITSVSVNRIGHDDIVVLLNQDIGTLRKTLSVILSPPVLQVTILIVITALVIKSVRHLVSNHHANSAVVNSVVGLRIEERRLQDSCREADLVCRGVIISVNRLRRHQPTSLIDRLTGVGQLILHLEQVRATDIRPI